MASGGSVASATVKAVLGTGWEQVISPLPERLPSDWLRFASNTVRRHGFVTYRVIRLFHSWVPPLLKWAASAGLVFLPAHASQGAEIKRAIAEIDVAQVSAPYRAALQISKGFPANVKLSFLGEDRMVLSSMDGSYAPSFGHVATRKFHFTVDVFDLKMGTLKQANQLRFDTETSDARFAALPSGKLLVDTGQTISALDQSQHVSVERSAAQVCGSPTGLDLNEPFRTTLLAASENVAFVSLVRAGRSVPPDGPPIPIDSGWACWFSTIDLKPIAQRRSKSVIAASSARDLQVYLGTSGPFSSLTPDGERTLSLPPTVDCDLSRFDRKFTQFPRFYLLHEGFASLFRCGNGTIAVERGDRVRTLSLKKTGAWDFRTDAWNVPLAIFVGGNLHARLFGGGFTGTTKARLVNYRTGESALLPELKISVPTGVYAGQTLQYAISPNGHYVAVLHGSLLSVYATPPELLK